MKNNKRIDYLDIIKGIGIILVVFGHSHGNSEFESYKWITSFHMPLFFIVSGFLISTKDIKEIKFKEFLFKKSKSLLIPYFLFSLIYLPLKIIVFNLNISSAIIHSAYIMILHGINAAWFLPCLFFVEILFYLSTRYISKDIVRMSLISIIYVGALLLSKANINLVVLIMIRVFVGLFYFSIGYYGFKNIRNINISKSAIIIFFIVNIFLSLQNGAVDLYTIKFNNPILYTIFSMTGSFSIILLIKRFKDYLLKIKILSFIGQNSLVIMGTHQIFILLIYNTALTQSSFISGLLITVGILIIEIFGIKTFRYFSKNSLKSSQIEHI